MEINKDVHIISVIIPTTNRNTLPIVLSALNNQTRKPDEIIIMEDKEHLGAGTMRNKGFERSRGDLIAFLDDDTVPENDWLENFIGEICKYNADGVSGNYIEDDLFLHEIRMRRKFPTEVQINPSGFFGIGGNIMYRRSCLKDRLDKDGFIWNPLYKGVGEDIELAWRLKANGNKLVYVINYVKHLKLLSASQYFKFQFERGRGIYNLYISSKKLSNRNNLGSSLLWDSEDKSFSINKWIKIFWKRILGPFDFQSFSKLKYYIVFWIGEKFKSAGFLYQSIIKDILL
jgi:cellulose synthase/poly-beta-1,6-N-acetylglucosamine synthase-like glycosyltransferase